MRADPSYSKKWVWDPEKTGPTGRQKKAYQKGKAVEQVQERDEKAAELRTLFKRPRFGWKEVQQDDLRMSTLSEKLPAIGSGEVWLSKFLSHSGACSRRDVTELVLQGRIEVNGEVVKAPTVKIDPTKDLVTLDGAAQALRTLGELIWIMVYKPKGCLTTMEDPLGRKSIMDIVPFAKKRRLVPIGRIDRNASGLLLLTNDYEWHTILSHPRYDHQKTYHVSIYGGIPDRKKIQALQAGLKLPDEDRPFLPVEDIVVVRGKKDSEICHLRFTLREGRYRQIRRMFEYIGHPVRAIKRTGFGLIWLDQELRPGEYRTLLPKEIRKLKGPTILKRPTQHPVDRAKDVERGLRESDANLNDYFRGQSEENKERFDRKMSRRGGANERQEEAWEEDDERNGEWKDSPPKLGKESNYHRDSPHRSDPWLTGEDSLDELTKGLTDFVNADKLSSGARGGAEEAQEASAADLKALGAFSGFSDEVDDDEYADASDDEEDARGAPPDGAASRLAAAAMDSKEASNASGEAASEWEKQWMAQLDSIKSK